MRCPLKLIVWLPVLAAVAGCGKEESRPVLIPVAGEALMNGDQLAGADIAFHLAGEAPEGYTNPVARTDEDGTFELQSDKQLGALPGKYKVTLNSDNVDIPEAYHKLETTPLTIEVTAKKSRGYTIQVEKE